MNIRRYDPDQARDAHNGTIKAHEVFPAGSEFPVPFESAWGYLDGPSELEPHAHDDDEVYVICRGKGRMTVGEERAEVGPGDVIEIPGGLSHSIANAGGGDLLWFALWWGKK